MAVSMRPPRAAALPAVLPAVLMAALLAALCLAQRPVPAGAVVGGAEAQPRSAVMVLSSNGGVCSGIVLAPDVVLTAGHCAAGGLEHRIHYKDEAGAPVLVPLAARSVHPGYDAGAVAGRRRSIDLALLRTASPLPGRFVPAALTPAMPQAGASLDLAGYGAARPGDPRSTGTFRSASLAVVEPYGPSRILVWLRAAAGEAGAGKAGGCQGDSGGPVSEPGGAVVAVTAWIGAACGGLTQGVLVGPQRDWIDRTLQGWSRSARWTG